MVMGSGVSVLLFVEKPEEIKRARGGLNFYAHTKKNQR